MKTALTLAPILLVLAVPAPAQDLPTDAPPQAWFCSKEDCPNVFTFAPTQPNNTIVMTKDGTFAEVREDGQVRINWTLARAAAKRCYSDRIVDIGWEACAFAQALVAARDHKAKVLP